MRVKQNYPEQELVRFFPQALRTIFQRIGDWEEIEEVRLKTGKPLMVRFARKDAFVSPDGALVAKPEEGYLVCAEDLNRVVNIASGASLYAFEEEIRNGYITLPGGHRLGLAGQVVLDGGRIKTQKNISALNLRLAREIKGAADEIVPLVLVGSPARVCHTLIVSPPRGGKTTVLRDLVRQLSDGVPRLGLPGVTIGLVDERSEIAACHKGIPQLAVGARTDVLDSCPKAEGIRLMLRAFGPEVVATDEIGRAEDARAIEDALNAGVKVVATAHAGAIEELKKRPFFRYLFTLGVLERLVFLERREKPGRVAAVMDGLGRPLGAKAC